MLFYPCPGSGKHCEFYYGSITVLGFSFVIFVFQGHTRQCDCHERVRSNIKRWTKGCFIFCNLLSASPADPRCVRDRLRACCFGHVVALCPLFGHDTFTTLVWCQAARIWTAYAVSLHSECYRCHRQRPAVLVEHSHCAKTLVCLLNLFVGWFFFFLVERDHKTNSPVKRIIVTAVR